MFKRTLPESVTVSVKVQGSTI